MNPDSLHHCLSRHLSGELSEEETLELLREITRDPGALGEYLSFRELDHDLRRLLSPESSDEAILRGVENVTAPDTKTDSTIIRQVVQRFEEEEKRGLGGPTGGPGKGRPHRHPGRASGRGGKGQDDLGPLFFLAAAFLVTLALSVLFSASGPSPRPGRSRDPGSEPGRTLSRAPEGRPDPGSRAEAPGQPLPPESPHKPEEPRKAVVPGEKAPEAFRPPVGRDPRALPGEEQGGLPVPRPPTPGPSPASPPAGPPETRSAAAHLEKVEGDVWVVTQGQSEAAEGGRAVQGGQGIRVGASGRTTVKFADGTRIDLRGECEVRDVWDGTEAGRKERGKVVFLSKGALGARVAKQPAGRPMVFGTPDGEAWVLGTTLRIRIDPDPARGTRLEVDEGKVRLRNLAGQTVEVPSGHYAVAAPGGDLSSRPIPLSEVVLLPQQAKLVGFDWTFVRDQAGVSGMALEALPQKRNDDTGGRLRAGTLGYCEWTFPAEGEKDYFLWVRGACLATTDVIYHDMVGIDPGEGRFQKSGVWPPNVLGGGPNVLSFDGFSRQKGYWWVGGDAHNARDEPPAIVRFPREGPQTIRLYPLEVPMRVDAIWLTQTQSSRPAADFKPGVKPGK